MLTFHILNVYVDNTQQRQFKFTFKDDVNAATMSYSQKLAAVVSRLSDVSVCLAAVYHAMIPRLLSV